MIAIVDYGVGNLFSLGSSLAVIGEESVISSDKGIIEGADRIILPGVGAFRDAMEKLRASGLIESLSRAVAKGTPLLGICLGMQLLFDKSYEYGEHDGLGFIKGVVAPIPVRDGIKIPHMGWNVLSFGEKKHTLFRYLSEGDYVYFVHSYYGADCDDVIATTDYGAPLTAAVESGNVCGCQFHPEKSGAVGLNILRAFCEKGAWMDW